MSMAKAIKPKTNMLPTEAPTMTLEFDAPNGSAGAAVGEGSVGDRLGARVGERVGLDVVGDEVGIEVSTRLNTQVAPTP